MPELIVEGPGGLRSRHTLTAEEVWVGSAADCSVRIPHSEIAPRHALIASGVLVRDPGSKGGLFYEGNPVPQHLLRPGQWLTLGSSGRIRMGLAETRAVSEPTAASVSDRPNPASVVTP